MTDVLQDLGIASRRLEGGFQAIHPSAPEDALAAC
jgi:hypothetical protein